ncbi:down syndrome cell adhesion molecule-like protein Dscam2 [Caerostris darwini]|uniref:Down syndrome cell adhesion molecule-like protein Dscam2 n=1 Tax=Caerostris darwini TaxID=1538125 RepID=A0AAV4N4X2_9ARAC|nr:down syndrome cell adhesion molecule-like protein Dscam2 [Caerostris darwini]
MTCSSYFFPSQQRALNEIFNPNTLDNPCLDLLITIKMKATSPPMAVKKLQRKSKKCLGNSLQGVPEYFVKAKIPFCSIAYLTPLAPDKRLLLSVNSTTVTVNLNSWHNGGCPVRFFVIQYKISGHQEWTLVSNNVIPEQQTVTITDLVPGTWYSLLMTARNDAGSTDAEYIFATLTLSGEYPPRPSEVSDVTSPFYRHLTITVPVVSSAIVLILVICVVCVITKRRTPGCRPRTPDVQQQRSLRMWAVCVRNMKKNDNNGADGSDTVKQENIPLSATYDSGQDPTYFPAPYATSRVQNYNREHCVHPGMGNQQNTGTFGSTRSGYTYNIPCPPRRSEKEECIYQTPAIYFSTYHHTGDNEDDAGAKSRKAFAAVNDTPMIYAGVVRNMRLKDQSKEVFCCNISVSFS